MKKLIKKLVLKYLSKYVGKEFTQMDNRIYDIEVKLGIHKPEHDAGSKYVGDMAVKDAEHLKGAKEPHFLELPEMWKVWFNEEQKHLIKHVLKWKNPLYTKEGFLVCDEERDYFVTSDKTGTKGYTEISFSDFERLVLKKEEDKKIDQPKEVQEIDFSVPGQKVNIAYGNYSSLIITSGKYEGDCFEGLCVESTKEAQIGTFGKSWSAFHAKLQN